LVSSSPGWALQSRPGSSPISPGRWQSYLAGVHPIGFFSGAWGYVGRLLVGLTVGAVGGLLLSRLLKLPQVVPAESANLVALAGVWAVFGAAEALQPGSGIMAAVAMGLAPQREAVPEERRLRQFKEQLTVLGISLIFVLLAAALPMGVLKAESWRGLFTVLALMFVVRPHSDREHASQRPSCEETRRHGSAVSR